jgi:hypothetical protein
MCFENLVVFSVKAELFDILFIGALKFLAIFQEGVVSVGSKL